MPDLDFRLVDYYMVNGCCTLCGQPVCGNLGKASHMRKHESEGKVAIKGARHKRGAARYAIIKD